MRTRDVDLRGWLGILDRDSIFPFTRELTGDVSSSILIGIQLIGSRHAQTPLLQQKSCYILLLRGNSGG